MRATTLLQLLPGMQFPAPHFPPRPRLRRRRFPAIHDVVRPETGDTRAAKIHATAIPVPEPGSRRLPALSAPATPSPIVPHQPTPDR